VRVRTAVTQQVLDQHAVRELNRVVEVADRVAGIGPLRQNGLSAKTNERELGHFAFRRRSGAESTPAD